MNELEAKVISVDTEPQYDLSRGWIVACWIESHELEGPHVAVFDTKKQAEKLKIGDTVEI